MDAYKLGIVMGYSGMDKSAGYWTELLSGLNPLNMIGGSHIGMGAAALTPTRNLQEQAVADEDMWKNLLIPGVGGYNAMKRLGTSIRGPEIKQQQRNLKRQRADEGDAKAPAGQKKDDDKE